MRVNRKISCDGFPCGDVNHECYVVPKVDIKPSDEMRVWFELK